eukprot:gb/GECG01008335.1/.p1 GENE.gb/GECG01008335.1/~~gb/GECG01008335.1/.p1  ORF type:complete len:1457 (+),score=160.21 gb/GECG01008335.1/:1-4371(+)
MQLVRMPHRHRRTGRGQHSSLEEPGAASGSAHLGISSSSYPSVSAGGGASAPLLASEGGPGGITVDDELASPLLPRNSADAVESEAPTATGGDYSQLYPYQALSMSSTLSKRHTDQSTRHHSDSRTPHHHKQQNHRPPNGEVMCENEHDDVEAGSHSSVNSGSNDYMALPGHNRSPQSANGSVTSALQGSRHTRRDTLNLRTAASSNAARDRQAPGWCKRLQECCCHCCRPKQPRGELRQGEIGVPDKVFADNSSKTSKYTALNFVPKSLLEQFRRLANIYFLGISILMIIGTYAPTVFDSPLSPFSTLGPLLLVLAITMVKEGLEDVKRHRSDREVNNRTASVIYHKHSTENKELTWRDLRVGHLVKVFNDHESPADVIVLQTSYDEGSCYIETSNIDGETDLKLKGAVPEVASRTKNPAELRGTFECDHPNDFLHVFNGAMKCMSQDGKRPETYGVTAKNVVLRGSRLRNTDWIIGLVVYTGKDTKVMKKGGSVRSKLSKIEKTMNKCLMIIFSSQFILCTITTVASVLWESVNESNLGYLDLGGTNYVIPRWLGNWFSFLVLYNNFIPISLYVTVEMVNYMQAYFIDKDVEMYDTSTDTPAKARTSNINQDLGQIEYIFSDKTGTLTQNVMEFRMFSIGTKFFGTPPSGASNDDSTDRRARRVQLLSDASENNKEGPSNNAVPVDEEGRELLSTTDTSKESTQVKDFFLALSVCHTVTPYANEGGSLEYQAESPDEAALVRAAKDNGFVFQERSHTRIVVDVQGTRQVFDLKGVHQFTSSRKRMSVVVVHPSGTAMLYCKGADDVMLKRASSSNDAVRNSLPSHLHEFASEGLRTLVIAKKELSASELHTWQKRYDEASSLSSGRDEALFNLADEYEQGLELVGASGIEDKLQDGVPETIRDIRRAGVKMWVLTGDKIETAINIGRSCNLIDRNISDSHVICVAATHASDVTSMMDDLESRLLPPESQNFLDRINFRMRKKVRVSQKRIIEKADKTPTSEKGDRRSRDSYGGFASVTFESPLHRDDATELGGSMEIQAYALVITGEALGHILGHGKRERQLLRLSESARSVIACRVSPAQKAKIVSMVKRRIHPSPMTLAIGDGANDVNMLQKAEVGIGISGREGLQAVNSSDFAIAQFRFLKRLMLLHGRWNYTRMSKVVLYSFYKNVVITLTLFAYNAFTGFSGQTFYESLVYSGYNFFLGLPIIMVGVFDRDLKETTVLERPEVYVSGLQNMDVNPKIMTAWLLHSVLYALVIFFVPYAAYSLSFDVWSDDGLVDGLMVAGQATYTALIMAMQLRVAMVTNTWTVFNHVFLWLSIIGYFGFILVYSRLFFVSPQFFGVAQMMLSRPTFWLVIALVVALCLCIEYAIQTLYDWFFSGHLDHYNSAERNNRPFPTFQYDDGEVTTAGQSRTKSAISDGRKATKDLSIYQRKRSGQKRPSPRIVDLKDADDED